MQTMLRRLMQNYAAADISTPAGRAIVEERYWSLRRQVPIVYLLGLVNLSAMELATTGRLVLGLNLPTFIGACGVIRIFQWFGHRSVTHAAMVRRMYQTIGFALLVCLAVCLRCLDLLATGDSTSHMAVLLFGGLTAIGIAYGLTALPAAGRIPLLLIIGPISIAALASTDPRFAGAAFGLVVVAALTLRLLDAHSRHFTAVVRSRSVIAGDQERVEQAHQEAIVAATTDFLTGLPNRRAFVAALEAAAGKGGDSPVFAVAILDLDRFKQVNDTFGHGVGDQLLREVADRLVAAVGDLGLVARLGGDEFGILIPGTRWVSEAQTFGRHVVDTVNGHTVLSGRQLVISTCCGIALGRRGEQKSPSRHMADADLALYQAKANPVGGVAVFEQHMEAPRRRRVAIETALLAPGICDRLDVMFQPIFNLKSGRVIAHEALARWNDPEIGPVSPSEFVPIAEHLNLIDHINDQLMKIAFDQARRWPDEIKLSFNLSAIQICSAGSAERVLNALGQAGLDPHRLQVEVTETALLADFRRARENLTALRAAGVTIALDDFGAGYASIGYLRELKFEQIKLDGGLVTAAEHSADGRKLLRAVILLCEILGVESIAEHVENEELLELVSELGCSGGQGFWLGAPTAADNLPQVIVPRWAAVRRALRPRAA